MKIIDFNNFEDKTFRIAFQMYFDELGCVVNNWDELFKEMKKDPKDKAKVIIEGKSIIGFLIYRKDELENWFLKEPIGFIREFWIHPNKRNKGYGTNLLKSVENALSDVNRIILTPDKKEEAYYIHRGYRECKMKALNELKVFVKG